MTIETIRDLLHATVHCGAELLPNELETACGCDLMSDVLAFPKERMVLLTGLVNPHVVRTAEMLDVICLVFVRGKQPSPEIIQMALERSMAVLSTRFSLYVACGILYAHGLPGDTVGG